MSYCRWSTDDFLCDLYVYETADDWVAIHVAGNRPVGEIPKRGVPTVDNAAEYCERMNAQLAWLDTCEREDIDLPHAGESFGAPHTEALGVLLMLRELGYRFPDSVIDGILGEVLEHVE